MVNIVTRAVAESETETECARCDEDLYEDLLTEVYGSFQCGHFEFDAGRIFKELDPIAFRCGMSEVEEGLCDECLKDF